jgi:probable F420-dependent oxidoreductase
MDLGRIGVWAFLDPLRADETAAFARRVESLGYGTLWFPEIRGRNSFVQAGWLLAATQRMIVASGIANIYLREPFAAATAQRTLAEQSRGRYLLGLGLSHKPMVEGVLARDYASPLATVRAYLDGIERAAYASPEPAEKPPLVLAALASKLLAMAAERTQGAHTFLVPPAHTAFARRALGDGPWLCVEQKVLLESDPARARSIARKGCAFYLGLANYQASLRRLGYEDADLVDGGSDRLIDALVAWGSEAEIAARIQKHFDAGASHVCINPIDPTGGDRPDARVLEALAPGV